MYIYVKERITDYIIINKNCMKSFSYENQNIYSINLYILHFDLHVMPIIPI